MRHLSPFLISLALLLLSATRTDAQGLPSPGIQGSTTDVSGPGISAATNRAQALDSVARQLASYFNTDGTLVLETQKKWDVPATTSPVEVFIAEYPKELSSLMIVRLRLVSAGDLLSEPTIAFRAQLMRDVYIAKNPMERETLFDPELFDVRAVDILREREPVLTGKPVKDMMISRSVASGRVLSWSDLAKRPLVRRGEWVEVAATDGALTIVLRAQALENGSLGDFVRVRNMESRKDFNAIVVADNRAEVRF